MMTRIYPKFPLFLLFPILMAFTFHIDSSNDEVTQLQEKMPPVFDLTTDSLALVALYNSTNGNNWLVQWNLSQRVRFWFGVTVVGGRVVELDLNALGLSGTLPPDLGNLSELKTLIMYGNQIGGSIPPELGNLSNNLLELLLSDNQLTGSIPPELGNLSTLSMLGLGGNQLSGSIPPELGNLSSLNLMYLLLNQLTGSIPPELGNLSNVVQMYLDNNQLTGSIPPELGKLTPNRIHLNDNNLSGCFHPDLINLCSAVKIDCTNNPNLPGGGDFDEFCANGILIIPNVTISIASGTYQAYADIISAGVVLTGNNVTFEAGRSILLNPNFTVEAGAEFTADIEICN